MPEETNELNDVQKRFNKLADEGEEKSTTKHTYEYGELYDNKDIEQTFLLPDLLPSAQVAVLIGEDGIGKTQLVVQLCLTIALNLPTFMEVPLHTETNRALIVATEESKEKFIKAAVKQQTALAPDADPKKIKIQFMEGADLDSYDHLIEEIESCCKAVLVLDNNNQVRTYDLIAIDALSDLFTLADGNSNDAGPARKILGALQSICKNYNTTVMIIHHVAKTKIVEKHKVNKIFIDRNDSQGTGAITQKPRTVLALTHDPRTIQDNGLIYRNFLHVVKANSMPKTYVNNTFELQFEARTLLHRFVAMTDREIYEKNQPTPEAQPFGNGQAPSAAPVKKLIDFVLMTKEQHDFQMKGIFKGCDTMTRDDLVERLRITYEVGVNKITEKNGLLGTLVVKGLLIKTGRSDFRYLNSNFKPAFIPFDENNIPPEPNPEEPTPF